MNKLNKKLSKAATKKNPAATIKQAPTPFFILATLTILTITLALTLPEVNGAPDRVIINSADWIDVYSGMLYANLKGVQGYFLTSPRHATILPYSIPKTSTGIEIISSRNNLFAAGYKALLEVDGYKGVEELRTANANLDLAEKLPDITKFIIIDNSYGYNAISVAPLAIQGKYYVLFADKATAGRVNNFLEDRKVDEIIIYGQVDREVKTALEKYKPETINTGDRFDNNIEIVKRYQEIYTKKTGGPRKQAILTNGEFIENSLMNGADPILFIGFSNVPDQVKEYISESSLEVGTLVGNELIGTATFIRRQTGLSVFVKFGQGSRTPQNTISQVEDLDRFAIPRYGLNLNVVAASINTATNNLEVTYQNKAPIATYFKALSIIIRDDDSTYTLPEEGTPAFIDANDYKTILYELNDLDGNEITLKGEDLRAQITTIYGESPKALEQTLFANVSVQRVSILDEAEIEIVDAAYSNQGSRFLVDIKNIGKVDAYVSIEIPDLYVNGEYIIFSSDEVVKIGSGKTKSIPVTTTMTEDDIPENQEVKIRALYGERENALTKQKQATRPFKFAKANFTIYIIILLIILLLLLIFLRKKCKNCGHKNPLGKKTCKKCGNRL